MDWSSPQVVVYLLGVLGLTVTAAYTDSRMWKIPNWLTFPMFLLGWVYQGVFHGWAGLADGGLGFLIGFGIFFLLWMIGSGAGGDTKLIGAISVWMGMILTLYLLVISLVFVILCSLAVVIYSSLKHGIRKTQKQLLATGKSNEKGQRVYTESLEQRRQRRILPFAIPVLMATLCLLALDSIAIEKGQIGPHKVVAKENKPAPASQELTKHEEE